MITLRTVYALDDSRFDEAYFLDSHLKLARDILTPEYTGFRVLRGVAAAGQAPVDRLIVEFEFPSREAFKRAMASPRMTELRDDTAHYTDRRGVITVLAADAR